MRRRIKVRADIDVDADIELSLLIQQLGHSLFREHRSSCTDPMAWKLWIEIDLTL